MFVHVRSRLDLSHAITQYAYYWPFFWSLAAVLIADAAACASSGVPVSAGAILCGFYSYALH